MFESEHFLFLPCTFSFVSARTFGLTTRHHFKCAALSLPLNPSGQSERWDVRPQEERSHTSDQSSGRSGGRDCGDAVRHVQSVLVQETRQRYGARLYTLCVCVCVCVMWWYHLLISPYLFFRCKCLSSSSQELKAHLKKRSSSTSVWAVFFSSSWLIYIYIFFLKSQASFNR